MDKDNKQQTERNKQNKTRAGRGQACVALVSDTIMLCALPPLCRRRADLLPVSSPRAAREGTMEKPSP